MTTPIILDVDTVTADQHTKDRVVVVGSMNMDLTVRTARLPAPGETVIAHGMDRHPGGKGGNQAAAAALLGASAHLIAAVGDDPEGTFLKDSAASAGVGTKWISTVPETATGTALIAVDDKAENFIMVSPGANSQLTPEHVDESLRALRHAAVLSLSLEVPVGTVLAAAQLARMMGAKTLLNLSPYSPGAAKSIVPMTDVLVLNETEVLAAVGMMRLPEDRTWEVIGALLGELGAKNAVVTLGSAGAVVLEGLQIWPTVPQFIPAAKVTAADTTGCGDAFAGALAAELARGADLTPAAKVASQVAAYAATGLGAQSSYPSRRQLADWVTGTAASNIR
ncbi:ribokinase [Arthrobacter sp. B2a2-09]|uniref:ribokinase n=1 Tax=Arthrobacter sp. B2a2-09 TaxID=2952822 RepID=UPI0022CD22E9|nr:ribokinase [Arthrobacter sp. B2a2-09]MCZ9882273.1 ribokinase [Arthrobacter sp. B2a2-09]